MMQKNRSNNKKAALLGLGLTAVAAVPCQAFTVFDPVNAKIAEIRLALAQSEALKAAGVAAIEAMAAADLKKHQCETADKIQHIRLDIQESELAKAANTLTQLGAQLKELKKLSREAENTLRQVAALERKARLLLGAEEAPKNCGISLLQEGLGMPIDPAYYVPIDRKHQKLDTRWNN